MDRPERAWEIPRRTIQREGPMQFSQRQWMMMALFAIFWTAFMLFWNGDYGTARIAILLVVGCLIALAWGWSMKKWGGWKEKV
jgi:hypothetical protein